MDHVRVVEASEHMDYGICLTDVCQEFIPQAFAFRCTFHKSGNVYDFNRRRHNASGINYFSKFVKTVVGHTDNAYVRLDSAKREICRLRLGVRQAIE